MKSGLMPCSTKKSSILYETGHPKRAQPPGFVLVQSPGLCHHGGGGRAHVFYALRFPVSLCRPDCIFPFDHCRLEPCQTRLYRGRGRRHPDPHLYRQRRGPNFFPQPTNRGIGLFRNPLQIGGLAP